MKVFYFRTVSQKLLTDSIQIVHVVVTGFQGVPYFKVTLNSHVLKSYIEFTLFSIEYTGNNLRNFIQILHVYVTAHRLVHYNKVTLNSQ